VVHDARITSASARASGAAVATLTGHSSWVLSSDISPDNRLLVSGYASRSLTVRYKRLIYVFSSSDKSVKVWDIGARAAVSTVRDAAGGGDVWAVAWRPLAPVAGGAVGGAWVCGGDDGVVRWYRAAG
jgi:WD repeat-containing protein 61